MVIIPVVAHQLYGTCMERVALSRPSAARSPAIRDGSPWLSAVPLPFEISSEMAEHFWIRNIDRSHGTQRTRLEIPAFFSPVPDLPFTGGLTVNAVWAPAEIEFRLIDTVEHSIDSDLADMMSADTRIYEPLAESLGRSDAVNLFLVRALEGADGRAMDYYAPGGGRKASAFLGDLGELDATSPRWQRDIVVIAHELGHLLALPHMPHEANLMHPAAGPGATILANTQRRIAEARAILFPRI